MKLGRYKQSPNDEELYTIDYSDWLDTEGGELLSAFEVVSWSPTYVGPPAFNVSPVYLSLDNLKGLFKVTGGEAGEIYEVTLKATSTAGRIINDCVEFNIEEPCDG